MTLSEFFERNTRVALGFSGGVDSAYLLYAAKKYGAVVKAYHVKTAFVPKFELDDAMRMAKHIGVEISILECDILSESAVISNPPDRCYLCKTQIFGLIYKQASKDGYSVLIDGTNASDDANDRPGMKALRELSVRSPLRECGITKDEVRTLSKEVGLFTWNKPAYSCLATRIPIGETITADILSRIEYAENQLSSLGFSDFRVRVHKGAARLQIASAQMQDAFERRDEICSRLRTSFDAILLDLKGR